MCVLVLGSTGTPALVFGLKGNYKVHHMFSLGASNTVDGRNPAPDWNHGKPLFVGIYMGLEAFRWVA